MESFFVFVGLVLHFPVLRLPYFSRVSNNVGMKICYLGFYLVAMFVGVGKLVTDTYLCGYKFLEGIVSIFVTLDCRLCYVLGNFALCLSL